GIQPYYRSSPQSEFLPTRAGRTRRGHVGTDLGGRIDNAEAEELVAGMGFNLGPSSCDASLVSRRSRRRRRPSDDAPGDQPTHGQEVDLKFLEADDYSVPIQDVLAFERDGHTVTRGVFSERQLEALSPSILAGFEQHEMEALRQKVSVWFGDETALSLETAPQLRARLKHLAPDEVPFLQVFNMFRKNGAHQAIIEKLVLSPRLAQIAAQLLGCKRLRLYQDSTFCKRPGDGPTRWHSDLTMAPLDCNDFVTAWLPLAPVPSIREGGSPLVFASRSHRDFALNHWQDPRLRDDLSGRYSKKHYAPLNAGDLTWHHGWTLHTSPGNRLDEPRVALAISYMRDGTRLLHDSTGWVRHELLGRKALL
ncbi:unnamed protein product, partial [Ascophyllum nodosum]